MVVVAVLMAWIGFFSPLTSTLSLRLSIFLSFMKIGFGDLIWGRWRKGMWLGCRGYNLDSDSWLRSGFASPLQLVGGGDYG